MFAHMHLVNIQGERVAKTLQECIHGSHWAPGVSASLSGLPARLPVWLTVFLTVFPSVWWDCDDSQSRKSRQDAEVSHVPWWNTLQPRGFYVVPSLTHSLTLLLFNSQQGDRPFTWSLLACVASAASPFLCCSSHTWDFSVLHFSDVERTTRVLVIRAVGFKELLARSMCCASSRP